MPHNFSVSIKKVLVVRTDRIGDVLLSTPVLSILKLQETIEYLAMMVSPYTKELIEGHPDIDHIIVDDTDSIHGGIKGFWALIHKIKKYHFDTIIVLHPTLRLAILGLLAGIPVRVGTGYRWYSFLFNHRHYEHRKNAKKHEVLYNLNLLTSIGITEKNAVPKIFLSDEEKEVIHTKRTQWGLKPNDSVVVLHPGSGGSARDWPADLFANLGDRLTNENQVKVIITGGPNDATVVNEVIKKMQVSPMMLVGETSIKELAALLASSSVCVTNSTGPMHMAAAVGTPTVALFCPITPASPNRWGPYGEGHIVLTPDVPACPKCIETACPYFDCMTRISVDSVAQAVQKILKKQTTE